MVDGQSTLLSFPNSSLTMHRRLRVKMLSFYSLLSLFLFFGQTAYVSTLRNLQSFLSMTPRFEHITKDAV